MLTGDPEVSQRILNGDVPEEVRSVNFQGQQFPLLLVTHVGRLGYRDLGDDTYQIVVETTEDAISMSMARPNPLSESNNFERPMVGGRLRYNDPALMQGRWKGMGGGNRATIFARTKLQQQHVAHISQLRFRLLALLEMVKCPCGESWVNPDAPENLRQMLTELGVQHYEISEMPEWLHIMVRVMLTRQVESTGLEAEQRDLDSKINGLTAASREFAQRRLQLQHALTGNGSLGDAMLEPIRTSLEGLGPQQESVEGALINARTGQTANSAYLLRARSDHARITAAMLMLALAQELLDGTGLTLGIAAEETDRRPLELEDALTRALQAGTDTNGTMQGSAAPNEKVG
jgi:hypothetical protein